MNSLSGFNSQEIRRLHPYLSALLRRIEALEQGTGIGGTKIIWGGGGGSEGGGGTNLQWGTDDDILPTGDRNSGGNLGKVARADHQHLFKFPTTVPASTPDGSAYFDPLVSAIRVYVNNTPTTRIVAGATTADVQPTGSTSTGIAPRYSFADHSHPTALLPQGDPQTPVMGEIRYNANNKLVRWSGSAWVEVSVETVEAGTNNDVQPTRLQSAGQSPRFARADHSHPTAILPQSDSQTPVANEIRFDTDNKVVRWNGTTWVPLSVETFTIDWGTTADVQPTGLKSAGTSFRVARADHSHPTALLPQSNSQTPVVDEIRYTPTNKLVRWIGSTWVDFISALAVPADPLVLPYDTDVISPYNHQLVNRRNWDNIGNATVFYRDNNNNQYRLIFARPLITCTTSTPSGKDVWTNTADEVVIKEGTGYYKGGVLWRRKGNTSDWTPLSVQLSDDGTSFPTDVGVLIRSALTGTSGSRRWFLRGAQEGGSYRAPFAGIATFSLSNTPAFTDLATNLNDGYAYFIHDIDRVDIVRPTTDGNKYCTMLSHFIIAPPCRVFSTDTDPSGHYVVDELWNNMWVISFYTTTSATTNLVATLPTIALPFGIRGGRALLYLHNPQSSNITTIFAVSVRTPNSTFTSSNSTSNTTINIPANTTVLADLGYVSFSPSSSLTHHRSYLLGVQIIRRRGLETSNANKVICFGVAIVPQRAS
jgi:hypothetical protein